MLELNIVSKGNVLFLSNSKKELKIFREDFIRFLISNNFKVSVVVPNDDSIEIFDSNVEYIYYNLNRKSFNPVSHLITFIQLFSIIKRIKPQVVLSYTILPNIFGTLISFLLNIRIICFITGLGSLFLSNSVFNPVIKLIYKFCLLLSSTVVSLNEFDFNFLAQTGFVNKNKLVLINGEGVNIEYFNGCPSLNSNEFFEFLFIGRIIKEKGILDFIAAAKKIIFMYPDFKVKFSILGSFDSGNRSSLSENEFYNEIGLFPQISYLGYESDVRGYINSCDCVVLPSYREGLSRVLLEAASMYKPIITSNVPGCSDLVVDGISGYLCEAKDYISLSDAMYKMFIASEQLKFNMGVSSRILVEKKYSSKIINNELFDLIRL